MAEAIFGNYRLPRNMADTPEQVKASLTEFFPELARSVYDEDSAGNLTFRVASGSKGAEAIFGNYRLPRNMADTPEQVKASLTEFFPELARSVYDEDSAGNLTFRVASGSKGC